MKTLMNKIKNLGVPAVMVLILGVGCSQYDAPTEASIKVSSISYSELMANPNHIIIGGVMSDDNNQIEVFLGDYIQAGQTFVEFNVHVTGPKSNSEKLNFEFYQLEN